jgi:hypothetical protein
VWDFVIGQDRVPRGNPGNLGWLHKHTWPPASVIATGVYSGVCPLESGQQAPGTPKTEGWRGLRLKLCPVGTEARYRVQTYSTKYLGLVLSAGWQRQACARTWVRTSTGPTLGLVWKPGLGLFGPRHLEKNDGKETGLV